MRNCSLWLDDQPIVERGAIVVDELKADAVAGVAR
jgi:hypothetical protein